MGEENRAFWGTELVALKSSPGAWGTAALAQGPPELSTGVKLSSPFLQYQDHLLFSVVILVRTVCSAHCTLHFCRAVGRASGSESGSVRSNSPEAAWCPSAISQEPQNLRTPCQFACIRSAPSISWAPLSPWLTHEGMDHQQPALPASSDWA